MQRSMQHASMGHVSGGCGTYIRQIAGCTTVKIVLEWAYCHSKNVLRRIMLCHKKNVNNSGLFPERVESAGSNILHKANIKVFYYYFLYVVVVHNASFYYRACLPQFMKTKFYR
jgi:hypothetical protein